MEQDFAGPKGRAEEVSWIVPPEHLVERPGWRAGREDREEPCKGMHQPWEAQWQQFLRGLNSPPAMEGKEPGPWEDTKAFLASFEQVAQACHWPREEWAARLLPALSGEAQEAFSGLEARDREDYGKVKAAILHGEANHMETLRRHFRQFRFRDVEDPRRIYSRLQELCRQWLRPERHSKEQILELLILEQFLAILPPELQGWIRAGGPENCTQAATMAEDFLLSQQSGAKTRRWQGVNLGCLSLQETLSNPAEMQNFKETEQAEISLPGNGSQWRPHSSSSLPRERQERSKAGQVQALTSLGEMGVSLQRTEHDLTLDQGQRTMFWQVLPGTSGKTESGKEALLVPRADLPFYLEQEEDVSLWFADERGRFTTQDSGDEKGSQFNVEHKNIRTAMLDQANSPPTPTLCVTQQPEQPPDCGGNKPRDPVKTQGDVLVPAEIQVEICESKGEQRKKSDSLQGQNESQKLLEGLRAVCNQTQPKNPRKENPLFSRYGRKYYLTSELTRESWDESSTSEENSDLDEHQRTSTGENSYKCPVKWNFSTGANLMKNQSGQTGEEMHCCPECGKSSLNPQLLMRHLKIHLERTTHTCPVCGKSLKWKHDLNRHLRIHTGEKPFKCPECGVRFSRVDNWLTHQRNHGRKMPYECPQCGKDFCRKSLMVKHQRIHQ